MTETQKIYLARANCLVRELEEARSEFNKEVYSYGPAFINRIYRRIDKKHLVSKKQKELQRIRAILWGVATIKEVKFLNKTER